MNSGLWKNGTIHLLLNTRAIYHITVLFSLTYVATNQPFEKKSFTLPTFYAIDFPSDLFASLHPVARGGCVATCPLSSSIGRRVLPGLWETVGR